MRSAARGIHSPTLVGVNVALDDGKQSRKISGAQTVTPIAQILSDKCLVSTSPSLLRNAVSLPLLT